MPRYVNHETRRRELVEAAMVVLGEQGLKGFALKSVAARLGGSVTMVTHYYDSRQALLDDLAKSMLAWWEEDLERIKAEATTPAERLRRVLEWLLPLEDQDRVVERGRVHLLADTNEPLNTRHLFEAWDRKMRAFIRAPVRELVPEARVEATVELLRTITNGIVLSSIEQPEKWPAERMLRVLDDALALMGLGDQLALTDGRSSTS
jgi:AcrR family transcriptional regulator